MYSILIIFLIEAFLRNAIREKCGSNWGCYCFLFERTIVKRFDQCRIFVHSPPGRRPNDKYPLNTSHRSQFVLKLFACSII